MMLRLAALALAGIAPAADAISLESPEPENYAVTLAVISVEEGTYEGYYVEGAGPDDVVIGGDPILMHRAHLIRRLAGPEMPDFRKVRRLAGGARIGFAREIPRMIAILEHTGEGYYYAQWSVPLAGRFACFPEYVRTHFKMRFPASSKPRANGDICIDV